MGLPQQLECPRIHTQHSRAHLHDQPSSMRLRKVACADEPWKSFHTELPGLQANPNANLAILHFFLITYNKAQICFTERHRERIPPRELYNLSVFSSGLLPSRPQGTKIYHCHFMLPS